MSKNTRKPLLAENLSRYGEKVATMQYEPLKITILMETPIATTQFLHFDGIIGHLVIEELMEGDHYNWEDNTVLDVPLPILEVGKEKKYFACSVAQYDTSIESVFTWKKRWDEEYDAVVDFGNNMPIIRHKCGQYKSYNMPLICLSVPTIWFYVVGVQNELEKLLLNLTHIGKKRTQGYGKVEAIQLQRIAEDWSCYKEGCVMRPIPLAEVDMQTMFDIQQTVYRPPYWNLDKMTRCAVPKR